MKTRTTDKFGIEIKLIDTGKGYFVRARANEIYISRILDACLSAWYEDIFEDNQVFDSIHVENVKYKASVDKEQTAKNNGKNVYVLTLIENEK
ncbi:hypothetical protein [Pseudoalteromonas marina]|uniref:Uncharacterized protein n=1 Tax=Pseudoalteromonas marina TaxID=267375 RepID=A0ABT9FCB1_9GAMM|nr:hypothetical protein [Pseudoalteromonas marina]MDP2564386.1 hypothetical protein [Pseudoalteromonas marina]